MRILVATASSFPETGGLETYCHELCSHLAQLGDEVMLFSLTPQPDPMAGQRPYAYYRHQPSAQQPRGRRNQLLWALNKPYLLWQLLTAVRSHQADCLLCVHWSPLGYLCALVTLITGVPFICFAFGHDILILPSGRLKRPVAKFLRDFVYARASAIFTISRYSKDRLVEIG